MKRIAIAEIFGPVIQGEGALIGVPTLFVRTGGCDFRCSWCDTMFAVDPIHAATWERLTVDEIVQRTDALCGRQYMRPMVTLSGGNPAMWPLGDLVAALQARGHRVAIETQGSVWAPWASALDHVTVSPKPPSSGQPMDWDGLRKWLRAKPPANTSLKVVVDTPDDLQFALDCAFETKPGTTLYVQTCNPYHGQDEVTPAQRLKLLDRYEALCGMVMERGLHDVVVLPQLHVLANGGGRGR
jgi:7-carboxy-7-deazaguanine synthase